jgi:hypothetical protein
MMMRRRKRFICFSRDLFLTNPHPSNVQWIGGDMGNQ